MPRCAYCGGTLYRDYDPEDPNHRPRPRCLLCGRKPTPRPRPDHPDRRRRAPGERRPA